MLESPCRMTIAGLDIVENREIRSLQEFERRPSIPVTIAVARLLNI
jgi:hypothetical protein